MDPQLQQGEDRGFGPSIAEAAAISPFLAVVNGVIRGETSVNPMSEKTALKFLISRKFDVKRALELYQMHEITRCQEDLTSIDLNDDDLRAELQSGKFTILKHRDAHQSAIAVFTARLHQPNKSTMNPDIKKRIHRNTLRGIVYQLDSALDDIITQRSGIVLIYNMIDSEYSNFDYELCQKILDLLKGAYPAKLKKVLIVSPPLWFRAPFHLLRLIVREKLRDRVWLLNMKQLSDHIPPHALTTELGGTYQHDHQTWIEECNTSYRTRILDLCDRTSAQTLADVINRRSSFGRPSFSASGLLEGFNRDLPVTNNNGRRSTNDSKQFDYDETGLSLSQFVEMVKEKDKQGLGHEYDYIVQNEDAGSHFVSMSQTNLRKNRYVNILCFDHTRVILEPYDLPENVNPGDTMDYINASYIDGYRQPRAYISTQGPTDNTVMDFWRMIWQTGSRVIVMVTLNEENSMIKCERYWPDPGERVLTAGVYTIELMGIQAHQDFIVTHLQLTNNRSQVSRDIWHLQFISWPDFGTPATADALLKFREQVLRKQLDAIESTGGSTYPPIVVHCSAGVGRSGTFITIDICIQKMETTGLVDVKSIVEKLRAQRYLSIQTKDQYRFCFKAVLEYAASCGLLSSEELNELNI